MDTPLKVVLVCFWNHLKYIYNFIDILLTLFLSRNLLFVQTAVSGPGGNFSNVGQALLWNSHSSWEL